jgi:hypothetical protein
MSRLILTAPEPAGGVGARAAPAVDIGNHVPDLHGSACSFVRAQWFWPGLDPAQSVMITAGYGIHGVDVVRWGQLCEGSGDS